MSYSAKALKVMIASPGDVGKERELIRDAISEWNNVHSEDRGIVLLPIGWDTHSTPEMGQPPQAIINKQILKGCDLLVAVFWTRIGTPTSTAVSGTVEEIEEHISEGKPAMLYFSKEPVVLDSVDMDQYQAVLDFKKKCFTEGLVQEYQALSDFRTLFSWQLTKTIIGLSDMVPGGTDEDPPSLGELVPREVPDFVIELSDESKALLLEACEDRSGTIMKLAAIGDFFIQTNGKRFGEPNNPRSQAIWESALNALSSYGFVEEQGNKGEVFKVTGEGYSASDEIKLYGDG